MAGPNRALPLSRELRNLAATLRTANPYLVLVLAALILALAYQVRPSYHLSPSDGTDAPFWSHINDREKIHSPDSYRWTTDASTLTLPGIGRGNYLLRLDVSGARPDGYAPTGLFITAGNGALVTEALPIVPAQRTVMTFHLTPDYVSKPVTNLMNITDAMPDGNLPLTITATTPFSPPGDPRTLGVVLYGVDVVPVGDELVIPSFGVLLPLTAAAAVVALLLGMLGWGPGVVRAAGLAWAGAEAGILIADRLFLTPIAGTLLGVLLAAGGLLLVLGPLWRALYRAGGIVWPERDQAWLLGIFAATFTARLAGQLHPQARIIDLIFHAHNLERVLAGNWLFTIKSDEWAGRDTFYLPTPYVFMLPIQALLNDELLTIKLFTVLLDTLCVFLVYYLAKRAFGDGRAGLLAAGLSVTFPIAVLPFSWGITANVFGQFFGLAAVTAIIGLSNRLARPGPWLLVTALLTLALLSHPGSVQLTGMTVGGIILVWGWRALRPLTPTPSPKGGGGVDLPSPFRGGAGGEVSPRAAWLALVAALAVAVALAVGGYYQHFIADTLQTLGEIRAERAAQAAEKGWQIKVGGEVNDYSLGLRQRYLTDQAQWLKESVKSFVAEAWAYFHTMPLILAVLGFWVAGRTALSPQPPPPLGEGESFSPLPLGEGSGERLIRSRMLAAAGVWAAVVGAYAVVGALANLYVRYPLWLAPLAALGTGLLLSRWAGRGRWGGWLVGAFMAAMVVQALAFWYMRIMFANK